MMTVALMLSGCTAIQNTVGGGGSSGGATGGNTDGTGGDTSGSSGTPIASFTRSNYAFNLYSCKRYIDNVSNVLCTFDVTNTSSYDSKMTIDARGDGYTRIILDDGKEFGTLGFKCTDCTNWYQNYTSDWYFRSQIVYKNMLFRFNVPVGVKNIKYLDVYFYDVNRLTNIPITN